LSAGFIFYFIFCDKTRSPRWPWREREGEREREREGKRVFSCCQSVSFTSSVVVLY
jgi:hypothetical protein